LISHVPSNRTRGLSPSPLPYAQVRPSPQVRGEKDAAFADVRGKQLRFRAASAGKQHPQKEYQKYTYADAVCCSSKWLAVCDGVSGGQKMGFSPEVLPQELLQQYGKVMDALPSCSVPATNDGRWLMSALEVAFKSTLSIGATTALFTSLQDSNKLALAIVGDCGMMLLRQNANSKLTKEYRSTPVMVRQKQPGQVVRLPDHATGEIRELIEGFRTEMVPCRRDDILVLGSDGLFDNLSDEDIACIVQEVCLKASDGGIEGKMQRRRNDMVQQMPVFKERCCPGVPELQCAATELVNRAIQKAVGPHCNPDDTTAIVAVLVEEESCEDESDSDELEQAEGMLQRGFVATTKASKPGVRSESSGMTLWSPMCCYNSAAEEEAEHELQDQDEAGDYPADHGLASEEIKEEDTGSACGIM